MAISCDALLTVGALAATLPLSSSAIGRGIQRRKFSPALPLDVLIDAE